MVVERTVARFLSTILESSSGRTYRQQKLAVDRTVPNRSRAQLNDNALGNKKRMLQPGTRRTAHGSSTVVAAHDSRLVMYYFFAIAWGAHVGSRIDQVALSFRCFVLIRLYLKFMEENARAYQAALAAGESAP